MRKFDIKSFGGGIALGALGVSSLYAAGGGISSAYFNDFTVSYNGEKMPLSAGLVSVIEEDQTDAVTYMPVREILEYLGYEVEWEAGKGNIDILFDDGFALNPENEDKGIMAMHIYNQNTYNISESGAFTAKAGQTLLLEIEADIAGGSVDLFLLDPNGRMERLTIESSDTKKIVLSEGAWQYNCSGTFAEGGSLQISGYIK